MKRLTVEQMQKAIIDNPNIPMGEAIAQAQLDQDKAECRDAYDAGNRDAMVGLQRQCQRRIERIFKEIEEGNVLRISTVGDWWQALKKQEAIK